MIVEASDLALLDSFFTPIASGALAAMPFELLTMHGRVAVPFFEQNNEFHYRALALSPAAVVRRYAHDWTNVAAAPEALLANDFVEIDSCIQYVAESRDAAYFSLFTEFGVFVGLPDALKRIYHLPPESLFAEACANAIGQGLMSLPRHADIPAIYALFGRQFEFPIMLKP